MKRFLALLPMCVLLFAFSAKAQNLYEAGANFDPGTQPRLKGVISVLVPLDTARSTFSYTSALFNKPIGGVATYGISTGVRRLLPIAPIYGATLWFDGQAGFAVSPSATSGSFQGGPCLVRPIKGRLSAVLCGKAEVTPVNGAATATASLAFQFDAR